MLYCASQRRQFTSEIAGRLRRGLGSFSLVAAPSSPGVWSLGPLLAAQCSDRVVHARVLEVDGGATKTLGSAVSSSQVATSLLVQGVNQIFEQLRFDSDLDHVREELLQVRDGVREARTAEGRIVLAAKFAAVLCRVCPIVIVVSNIQDASDGVLAEIRRSASYVAGIPCAVLVLLPAGTPVGNSVPPLFATSIPRLEADDARNLLSTVRAAHVDPMTASWIASSAGGRIDDIRENGAVLSAAALGGREMLPFEPRVSEVTRARVGEQLRLLSPAEVEALVASQLQLVQDNEIILQVVGTQPVRLIEGLVRQPGAALSPTPRAVTARAVIDSVPPSAVQELHLRLAQAYEEGSREQSWHFVAAGHPRPQDAETLLAATAQELDRGSLDVAWRLTEVFPLLQSETPRLRGLARLLEGQLALHLGRTLTASTRFLEASELSGLTPEEELEAITGYVCARGSEEMNTHEDTRMVARLMELAEVRPEGVARCLILMASEERLVGDLTGPRSHLRRAREVLSACDKQECSALRSLLDDLSFLAETDSVRGWQAPDSLMDIPASTPRSDIGLWSELVIRAYVAVTGEAAQRNVVAIEAMLTMLGGVSPFVDAHVAALHALLAERRGWSPAARERMETDRARVPMRVGLNGVGTALAARAAMLFGDDLTFALWRSAMTAEGAGGWSSPQQLWASVLEAVDRLAEGDSSLASLVLGPAVSAPVPRAYLAAVWSSVVDMVVLDSSLIDRVPGLAGWLSAGTSDPLGDVLDNRLVEVLLTEDSKAVPAISRLVLDAVVSGSVIWQVRANMACAARLMRSPSLDVTSLGISAAPVSSANVLRQRAEELALTHGLELWIGAARRLAPELRVEVASSSISPRQSHALTDAEIQVARLAAQGWRNKEIAGELYMAVRTVELRLTGVYRALGISSRKDLAQALIDARLMED